MKIKALKSFCSTVTMCPADEPKEVSDETAEKLIAAGYAVKVETEPEQTPEPIPESKPKEMPEEKPKKASKNAAE